MKIHYNFVDRVSFSEEIVHYIQQSEEDKKLISVRKVSNQNIMRLYSFIRTIGFYQVFTVISLTIIAINMIPPDMKGTRSS